MTQIEIPHEARPLRPGAPAEPVGVVEQKSSVGRLVGVDLARALAVFGMFAVHVAPASEDVSGFRGWLLQLAFGRSSVLFAMLAGFSRMLIAGRREPKTGLTGRQAKVRIAIRALVLLVLGSALTILQNGIIVILAFYEVYFLLALPLVRLRARTLAITAAVLAVVAPQAAFGLKRLLSPSLTNPLNSYDPIDRLGGDGLLDLLLNGTYPAITWLPYVIAGMALARLDLAAGVVQRRLAALGAALMAFGYGVAWLAPKLFPSLQADQAGANGVDMARLKELFANMDVKSLEPGSADFETIQNRFQDRFNTNPSSTALDLLRFDPHSGTTFDIVGSLGVASRRPAVSPSRNYSGRPRLPALGRERGTPS